MGATAGSSSSVRGEKAKLPNTLRLLVEASHDALEWLHSLRPEGGITNEDRPESSEKFASQIPELFGNG